jgi:hypothetical protein
MKLYDKVFVPCGADEADGAINEFRHDCIHLREEPNTVLISLQELREMWGTAMERRDRDVYARDCGKDDYSTAPTFEEYLKECGLTI